jgi:hypothetical protein
MPAWRCSGLPFYRDLRIRNPWYDDDVDREMNEIVLRAAIREVGRLGGKARARALTPEQRRRSAR